MTSQPPVPIQLKHAHTVYQNQFVTVHDDEVVFPSGNTGTYLRIVESDGSPGVAALVTRGRDIALVHVYRYPIRAWEWGIPRGFASSADPQTSMLRELREELGAKPHQLKLIGRVHANSGLLAGVVLIYHAVIGEGQTHPADSAEVDAVAWVSIDEVLAMIGEGRITDGFTLAALTLASIHKVISELDH